MLDARKLRDEIKQQLLRIGGGDREREQALIRVGIGSILLGYYSLVPLHIGHPVRTPDTGSLVLLFLVTVMLLLHVLVYAGAKPWRRLAGVTLDVSAITYFHLTSDAAAVPMYALYLWIVFGNGFRFGQRYLYFSLGLSLIGFGIAMLSLPQWRAYPSLAWGLWIGMLVVSLYVSHLLRRLQTALEFAESANMAKRRFVSSVSHELRTPLNAIIGMGALLRMTRMDHEQQDMLVSLEDASRLMLTLIEDVLDFSKIEAGKVTLEAVNFNLEELMLSATSVLRYQALGKGLKLHHELAPGTPLALQGDQHHLKQILVNLLSNAIKFTHTGEVACNVACLRVDGPQTWLRFEVRDTGIGIPQAAQARIFESFAQADDSTTRRYGGTGLGTTIAKQLVELMGGRIGVISTPGKGSLFWFELPLSCPPVAPVQAGQGKPIEAPQQEAPAIPLMSAPRALRVLVAEDNGTNAKLLQRILERSGHSYEVVPDGEQALDRLTSAEFDVALFDMNMPVLSGLDAVKAYRFMASRERRVPIAMFSADASVSTREECLRAGVDAYLTKPIQLDELLNTMSRLTGGGPASWPTATLWPSPAMPRADCPPEYSSQLDISALDDLEALGGSPNFLSNLIEGYIEDNRQLIERLDAGMAEQRLQECHEALHAMKGSAVSLGAIGMRRLCEEIERMDPKDLFRLRLSIGERCNAVFEALCVELKRRCGKNETRIKDNGNGRPTARST